MGLTKEDIGVMLSDVEKIESFIDLELDKIRETLRHLERIKDLITVSKFYLREALKEKGEVVG